MKRNGLAGLLALVLVAGAAAQDGQDAGYGKTVPKPTCCKDGKALPWSGYNKGVKWTYPIDDAIALAKKENKPLLVLHLVGDLNKERC